MPEGDTIFRAAASLQRWIGGRDVTAARTNRLAFDGHRLVGRRIEDVEARAKHLLMHLSGGLVLHSHMGMTGSWYVYPAGSRWTKPAHQARLVLEAGRRVAVCFNAPVVELIAAGDLGAHRWLRGPDVLGPALDPAAVVARAAARAPASPTVGELLLDQQVVSGIGNVYRCESLFLCGASPWLPSAGADPALVVALVDTASRLMRHNAATSAYDRAFEGAPGQAWVYRRRGLPCRRCGTVIERALLGPQARSVYWCPACQPAA
jgi:endonuclease-8